ncbi:MAG TPA: hypothetical protein P5191_08740 [Ruminococcus sp.]|nr:hypothetical protein [Ruminococcus sp.]
MKIRNIIIFAAAAMLLTSCGKKSSSSDNDNSLEGNWTICDSDGFASNEVSMEFKNSSEMSMTLDSGDYSLTYTGKYQLDGEKVSIEFDKVNNIEELKNTTAIYDKYGLSDDELEEILVHVNEVLTDDSGEYFISSKDEKNITKSGDEHKYRKNAYMLVADDIQRAAAISDITVKGTGSGRYCIVCSDKSLSLGADDSAYDAIKGLQDDTSVGSELSKYTKEEGFTENFSFDANQWVMVFYEGYVVGIGIGDPDDSSIFGTSDIWYIDETGASAFLESDEAPKTMNEFIDFYKSMD